MRGTPAYCSRGYVQLQAESGDKDSAQHGYIAPEEDAVLDVSRVLCRGREGRLACRRRMKTRQTMLATTCRRYIWIN